MRNGVFYKCGNACTASCSFCVSSLKYIVGGKSNIVSSWWLAVLPPPPFRVYVLFTPTLLCSFYSIVDGFLHLPLLFIVHLCVVSSCLLRATSPSREESHRVPATFLLESE